MTEAVGIRPAGVADAEAVAEVHVRSWQIGYRGQLEQDLLDALEPAHRVPRWRTTIGQSEWPRQGVLVAELAGHVVGFANLTPTRDADHDPASVGEITSFYVHPQSWRHGVGRQLMQASVAALTDAGFALATLWVLETNAPAIAFYRACGWQPDGGVKDDVFGGLPIRDLRYRRLVAAT